jgi:hypothetical protein
MQFLLNVNRLISHGLFSTILGCSSGASSHGFCCFWGIVLLCNVILIYLLNNKVSFS